MSNCKAIWPFLTCLQTFWLHRVPIEGGGTPHILSEQGANRGGDTAHQNRLPVVIGSATKDGLRRGGGGWVGGLMRIMPRCGFILQAWTCQILILAENPSWSRVWPQYCGTPCIMWSDIYTNLATWALALMSLAILATLLFIVFNSSWHKLTTYLIDLFDQSRLDEF